MGDEVGIEEEATGADADAASAAARRARCGPGADADDMAEAVPVRRDEAARALGIKEGGRGGGVWAVRGLLG